MKVIVGGCSVSDYTPGVNKVYGEVLAENINAEYIHHGAGCGSNYRIWRNITRMVMNNEISEDDILIIQYTGVNRQEFWSSCVLSEEQRHIGRIEIRNKKYDGDIIRFKSSLPMVNKIEQKFFNLKEAHFTSIEFDEERFEYNHFLFHNLLTSKNIKVVYLVPNGVNGIMSGYSFNKRHLFNKNNEKHIGYDLSLQYPSIHMQDESHWNNEGHKYVSSVLEKFIKEEQWL